MPVKGGGGIGGPRKKPKRKGSVGQAVAGAGKPLARPKPKRTVGKAVQSAGRPIAKPAPQASGTVAAGRRVGPAKPKRVEKKVDREVPKVTGSTQAAIVKSFGSEKGRRKVVEAVKREIANQDRKAVLRTALGTAPVPNYQLYRKKGALGRFLTGPDTTLELDKKGRVRPTQYRQDKAEAAALKILDQTLRPTRAIAGSVDAALKGKNVIAAQRKGLLKNKGPLFGDVLRDAGVPKGVAAPVGFFADVATDPTTYVTFGTGSVAKKAAQSAATKATAKAVKAGMSESGQRTVAKQAAKRAAAAAPGGRGVTVKFAGKEVPGVRRGTAAVARRSKVKTPSAVRTAGRQVNPRISPEDVGRDEFTAMKQTERSARATRAESRRRAVDRGRVTAEHVKPQDHAKVIDAIERGKIGDLPEHLRPVARRIRDDFRGELRKRRQGGVATGDITKAKTGAMGYVPHVSADDLGGKPKKNAGQRTMRPASSRTRKDRRPISEINVERTQLGAQGTRAGEAPYSTNLPTLHADYIARSGNARAQAQVARGLAEQGRDVAREVKKQIATAKRQGYDATPKIAKNAGESIYHVGGATGTSKEVTRGIRKVDTDSDEYARLLKSGTTKEGGRYVILPDSLVEEAYRNLGTDRTAIGAGFDKAMGAWKGVATATPGFHIRNMIGDTFMGYLGQRGRRMPANTRAATRALREQTRRDVAQKTSLGAANSTGKTVKLGGKTVPVSRFVDELIQNGVLRSGQRGRELEDLLSGTGAVKVKDLTTRRARARAGASKKWGKVERLLQNREDLMRAATYKEARDRGMSPAEAADWSMKHHIDYGDLTEAERVFGRRAAPFYTFTARALPLHAQRLVTNPGKFATLEKARQETAGAFGLRDGWEEDVLEYKQRAIPFGVKIGGTKMALDAQLPANTLNEMPGFKNPGAQLGEWGNFLAGLATPAGKVPVELLANRSFFFRRDIESDEYPNVSAPSWVKMLPGPVQDTLGVKKIKDRRTGKMVLGWPGRTDYIVRQVPGMPALLNSLATEGAGRSGRAGWEKWASASGVKFDPVDANTTRIFRLFEEQKRLEKQKNSLGQQGKQGGRRSTDAEVRDLANRIRKIDEQIYALSVKRGDAAPYRENVIGKGKAAQIRAKASGKQPASPGVGLTPGQQRMLEQRTTSVTGLTPGQQKMLKARMGR